MDKNFDRIQLPPLPADMDANAVAVLWEYIKMPAEEQERMKEYLNKTVQMADIPVDRQNEVYDIPLEGIEGFRKTLLDMIGNLIVEISRFSCWLCHQIYVQGESAAELIVKHPEAKDLIRIMSEVFEVMMKDNEAGAEQE